MDESIGMARYAGIAILGLAGVVPPVAADRVADGATLTQVGEKPGVRVIDFNQDGEYDLAMTLQERIETEVFGKCPKGKSISPSGLVGIKGQGQAWTADYFTFVYDQRQIPVLPVVLPGNAAVTRLPDSILEEAVAQCNAQLGDRVPEQSWTIADATLGELEYGTLCADEPDVFVDVGILEALVIPADFDSIGGGLYTTTPLVGDIECGSLATASPPDRGKGYGKLKFETPIEVKQSFLVATPKTRYGQCGVHLSGVITTNMPGRAELVYENHLHNQTGVHSILINHTKVGMIDAYIDFSTGGEGMWFEASSRSMPMETTFGANPGPQYQGYFKMVGVNPHFESNLAEYSFSCETPGASEDLTWGRADGGGGTRTRRVQASDPQMTTRR
jgi:hypothetical protein